MLRQLLFATCMLGASQAMAADAETAGAPPAIDRLQGEDLIMSLDRGWCTTYDRWKAVAPLTGDCPTEGDCDIPAVRDEYLTDDSTPFLVVRMHVVLFRADDGSDPVADESHVIERMAEINRAYFPSRVRFVYTWRYVDDSTYRYAQGSDDTMKQLYAFEPDRRCNFYVRGNNTGAYGYFPWWAAPLGPEGGVVCGGPFFTDAVDVPAHEMGHNLGLWHTHHGVSEVPACSACYERADGQDPDTTGDFAADTPATPINLTCDDPAGVDSCSGVEWGETLPESYMSYGFFDPDPCWDRFTAQQAARLHCWINAVLTSWLACASDFNDDGTTDFVDLLALLAAWGPCDACNHDINGDGLVDFEDLGLLLAGWGACDL